MTEKTDDHHRSNAAERSHPRSDAMRELSRRRDDSTGKDPIPQIQTNSYARRSGSEAKDHRAARGQERPSEGFLNRTTDAQNEEIYDKVATHNRKIRDSMQRSTKRGSTIRNKSAEEEEQQEEKIPNVGTSDVKKDRKRRFDLIETAYVKVPEEAFPNNDKYWTPLYQLLSRVLWFFGVIQMLIAIAMILTVINATNYAEALLLPAFVHVILGYLVISASNPFEPKTYVMYKNLDPRRERIIDSLVHGLLVLETGLLCLIVAHMIIRTMVVNDAAAIDPTQMVNAFMFNLPSLILGLSMSKVRGFYSQVPDPHATVFYPIVTLCVVGIGFGFLINEVLWRKSYAGKKIFRIMKEDLNTKQVERALITNVRAMQNNWQNTGLDWKKSPFYKIQRAVLLEKPDDLDAALKELDKQKLILNLTTEQERELEEYHEMVNVLYLAKEMNLRENLEKAMEENDLDKLQQALMEYRKWARNSHFNTAETHEIMKEARMLGLKLRHIEQNRILDDLNDALQKDDLKSAEELMDLLETKRMADEQLKIKTETIRDLFFEMERKNKSLIRQEIRDGARNKNLGQLKSNLKKFDRCGLIDESKEMRDSRKLCESLEEEDKMRIKREIRKALVDEENPEELTKLVAEYKHKDYANDRLITEAEIVIHQYIKEEKTDLEDLLAQMKMALLIAPDSLSWRELEDLISKYKQSGLEDNEGLLLEAELVLAEVKELLMARNKVLVNNLIATMQMCLEQPISEASNNLTAAIAACLDAQITSKDGPIEEAFLLQFQLDAKLAKMVEKARDQLGEARTVLELRNAIMFVENNKIPEEYISNPSVIKVKTTKPWPSTLLKDAKDRLAYMLINEAATLSATLNVGPVPNYRDLKAIEEAIERYKALLLPGEELEDTNYLEAKKFYEEYNAKLIMRNDGIKADLEKAIEEGKQVELAIAIREFKDAGITDPALLTKGEKHLEADGTLKELKLRLKEATQDENLFQIEATLFQLKALGVNSDNDRKCYKAEKKLEILKEDYEKKKKFLNELVLDNDVHQRSIMEMLVRDLSDLGYTKDNDPEITKAILVVEKLRVIESANKAVAEALISAMKKKNLDSLLQAIQDFKAAGLSSQDGPINEAEDMIPVLRGLREKEKKEKCKALERAIQRNSILALDLAINDFYEANFKHTDGPVLEATMVLELLKDSRQKRHQGYDKKLQDAMAMDRIALVETLIKEIENENLTITEVPTLTEAMEWIDKKTEEIKKEKLNQQAQDKDWSKSPVYLEQEKKETIKCEEDCETFPSNPQLQDKLERHKIRCLVLESRAQLINGISASKNISLLKQKENLTREEQKWLKEIVESEETNEFRKQLNNATMEKDAHYLDIVVKRIHKAGLQNRLATELAEAEANIKVFTRLAAVRRQVRELKHSLVAEIMSYREPPEGVLNIVRAVFYILGHELSELTWDECVKLMKKTGKDSLKKRIENFNPTKENVDQKHILNCRTMLKGLNNEEMMGVSMCAAVFGLWVTTVLDTVEQ